MAIGCTECTAKNARGCYLSSRRNLRAYRRRRAAPLPRARAFPCAGVRAEALRSTGCSDGRSTRRDASQCAVAFFRTLNRASRRAPGTARIRFLYSRSATRPASRRLLERREPDLQIRAAIRSDRLDLPSSRAAKNRKCDSRTRGNHSTVISARGAAWRTAGGKGGEKRKLIRPTDFSASTRRATWRRRNFRARFPRDAIAARSRPRDVSAGASARACARSFPRTSDSRKSPGARELLELRGRIFARETLSRDQSVLFA